MILDIPKKVRFHDKNLTNLGKSNRMGKRGPKIRFHDKTHAGARRRNKKSRAKKKGKK